MQKVVIAFIRGYQYLLSPFLGNHCRFHPTCSSYAVGALKEHGTWRGLALTFKRLGRCHPWHEGGYDPVPEKTNNKD